jgi:hypothetical protein
MNELRPSVGVSKTAVGIRKQSPSRPKTTQNVGWLQLKHMRKVVGVTLLICGVILAVEAVSSYILYRHYSGLHRGFFPAGSAAVSLAQALKARADGHHEHVDLSIDPGPLFRSDALLGYAMLPGRFQITEREGGISHRFSLTVDALGHRVTAFAPKAAARRLYITGDSAMFGWGLDDEQTIPWLLQTRFPGVEVVNLSLTSYSTVHAKLQLDRTSPAVTADDIVVLTYHPITNDFNVASAEMLYYLEWGFERQLGDASLLRDMTVPFATIGAGDTLTIHHYAVACALHKSTTGECAHPAQTPSVAVQVTIRTFDALMAEHPAHFVVAFLSGDDTDPVISHLRARGVTIADLRSNPGDPDASDEVSIDGHAGPFWHYNLADRLAGVLHGAHLGE